MSEGRPAADRAIDRRQLRELLRLYMRLAFRGSAVRVLGGGAVAKPTTVLRTALLMQLLVGASLSMFAFSKMDVFSYALLVAAATFFMSGLTLLSEAGDVLFNRAETDVLGHRPVSGRTLLVAKSASLGAFALLLALTLNLFPAFAGLACVGARWWFPAVHLLSIALLTLTAAALVVYLHGFLVRFVRRDRLDSWSAWAQVAMSVFFLVGYQLVPRLAERLEGRSLAVHATWLTWLPPTWSAGLEAALAGGDHRPSFLVLAALAVLAPVGLVWVALGRVAAGHAEAASRLLEAPAPPPREKRRRAIDVTTWPGVRWWLRDPVERATFRLAAATLARDREMRTRLFPQLALMVTMPILAILSGGEAALMAAMSFALVAFVPSMAIEMLATSSQHAAAGVFLVAPLRTAAGIFHGVRKAAAFFLLLPALALVTGLVALALPDPREAILLALLVLAVMPPFSLAPAFGGDYFPLSRPPVRVASARQMGATLLMVLMVLGLAAVGRLAIGGGWYLPLLGGVLLASAAAQVTLRARIAQRRLRAPD